jgi:hypothetical protein
MVSATAYAQASGNRGEVTAVQGGRACVLAREASIVRRGVVGSQAAIGGVGDVLAGHGKASDYQGGPTGREGRHQGVPADLTHARRGGRVAHECANRGRQSGSA